MSTLQELETGQIDQSLSEAAQRHVPVAITTQFGMYWVNYPSRLVAIQDDHLLLEMPSVADEGMIAHEFVPAERIGVSFKLKHYKHVFTATVAGVNSFTFDGASVPVVSVCIPTKMQRLQRRVYIRADVPPGKIVRVSFWLGGRGNEPAGTSQQAPVWFGRVVDISAGGFRALTDPEAPKAVEVGDAVGVHLSFGAADENVYADAQFRHAEQSDDKTLMGFQFVGMAQTPEGRQALDLISSKVAAFHRAAERSCARDGRWL